MKRVENKDLVIGKRYWIVLKGNKHSEFRKPLIFIGYKEKRKTPWFTFGDSVESWTKSFNYTPQCSKYNFYEESEVKV